MALSPFQQQLLVSVTPQKGISKKHQAIHVQLMYIQATKNLPLAFLACFLKEPCSCFSLCFSKGVISQVQPGSFCTSLWHSVFSVSFDSPSVMIYYIKQSLSPFFSLLCLFLELSTHIGSSYLSLLSFLCTQLCFSLHYPISTLITIPWLPLSSDPALFTPAQLCFLLILLASTEDSGNAVLFKEKKVH